MNNEIMKDTGIDSLRDQLVDYLEILDYPATLRDMCNALNVSGPTIRRIVNVLISEKEISFIKGPGNKSGYMLSSKLTSQKRYETQRITDFSLINEAEDLLRYLTDSNHRLKNDSYVCQYTSLRAAFSIIKSGYWYLGNPKAMNDKLEYERYDEYKWNNIFYSSFMIEKNESIGMWSMYAQPWDKGVMISIPTNLFKKWARETEYVYRADPETKKTDENDRLDKNTAKISIGRVAYTDYEYNTKDNKACISCGDAKNHNFTDLYHYDALIGLIKDEAWSYEKEIRLRVDLKDVNNFKGVSLKIPEYILKAIIITLGPRHFQIDSKELRFISKKGIGIKNSVFYNKLQWIPCDSCEKSID